MGAGAPKRALEVRGALFHFFIDIRYTLKGRLPRSILLGKAKELYDDYCKLKSGAGEASDQLKFTDMWLISWCNAYRISLKPPNKRFSISQNARKRIIIQF